MRRYLLLAYGVTILACFAWMGLTSILLSTLVYGLVGVGLGLWKKDRKMTCWAGTAFGLAAAFIVLFIFALAHSNM